jgi:hypothetical protein
MWDLGCEEEEKAKGASRKAGLEARGEERMAHSAERIGQKKGYGMGDVGKRKAQMTEDRR